MLHLNSFFEGHRGAVLSLVGSAEDKFFYSSGSEGLIVRWQRDLPNEGQVLLKLSGYVSSLAYNKTEKRLYAAVNHKGIYVINAESGVIVNTIDIPATSFGSIQLTNLYIIFTSKIGEIMLLDRISGRTVKRITTGLDDYSKIALGSDYMWYTGIDGLHHIDLRKVDKKGESIRVNKKVKSIGVLGKSLVVLTDHSLIELNLKKLKKEKELISPEILDLETVCLGSKSSTIHVLGANNTMYEYQLSKKGFELTEKMQISHIGQINDLLWIENHKFVISAGADKKIGVWQFN